MDRNDYPQALIGSMVVNSWGGKTKPEDLMPYYDAEDVSQEEMEVKMARLLPGGFSGKRRMLERSVKG